MPLSVSFSGPLLRQPQQVLICFAMCFIVSGLRKVIYFDNK